MDKYKGKALEIAESIQRENSLDMKFLLFSQFMRILFSGIPNIWLELYIFWALFMKNIIKIIS